MTPLDVQLSRIRGAYTEMPGLRLTAPQAATLLGLDHAACGALLDQLRALGFLRCGSRGHYVLADER